MRAAEPHWSDQGLCQSKPHLQRYWFPESRGEPTIAFAKVTCKQCPVRSECAQYAWDTRQEWGIWGGIDEWERKRALAVFDGLGHRPDGSTSVTLSTAPVLEDHVTLIFSFVDPAVTTPDLDDTSVNTVLDFHIDFQLVR